MLLEPEISNRRPFLSYSAYTIDQGNGLSSRVLLFELRSLRAPEYMSSNTTKTKEIWLRSSYEDIVKVPGQEKDNSKADIPNVLPEDRRAANFDLCSALKIIEQ